MHSLEGLLSPQSVAGCSQHSRAPVIQSWLWQPLESSQNLSCARVEDEDRAVHRLRGQVALESLVDRHAIHLEAGRQKKHGVA